jgi:predicted AlkP superfamily phosphohydrolase/phosphomutase
MPRTLLVGFDGALLDLCYRWMDDGRMPALSSICADGVSGGLLSVTPYNSAVAWSSLVTGTNPGRHGVFDFVLPLSGSYGYRVATRRDRRTPALWNHVSDAGGRVAVVNIPMTFPAEERLNGVMVSGMDAPGLEERAVHPAEHFAELKRTAPDYRIMSKAALAADHGDFALAERELLDVLRARSSYVCALASKRDFDLVVVNLEATDGSHHFFWQHHDPSHPRHDPAAAKEFGDAIGRVYEATDRELSRLIDAYAPDTVFVVSDHGGAGTNDWVVFTNDWLVEVDLLVRSRKASASAGQRAYGWAKRKMSVPARRALRPVFGKVLEKAKSAALYGDFDWSRSRAYALMQPAVWANMKGREPNGTVHGDELASVAAAVGDATSRLRLPGGQRVFTDSIRSDAVYAGDAPHGPDIVLELAAGMHIRSRNATGKPGHLVRLSDLDMYMPSGVHSPRGMFAAAGAGIARRGRLEEDGDIHQVAPSVLQSLGLTAGGMDAEPFGFVSPRGTGGTTVKQVDDHRPASAAVEPEPDGLNEAEEEEVLERLRGLGYVD